MFPKMAKAVFPLLLLLLAVTSASAEEHIHRINAHKELTAHGFPVGLIPTNIRNYSINRTSGEFAVSLGELCRITLRPANYLAAYSRTITGKMVKNRIAEIHGIRVWAFFKWWSITGIRSSGDDLVFEVGKATAKYPSKNFDEALACEGRKSES